MAGYGSTDGEFRMAGRYDSVSKSAFSKCEWKVLAISTMALVIGISSIEPGRTVAQDPATNRNAAESGEPGDSARKDRRRAKEKGWAAGKNRDNAKSKSGPAHRFDIAPPVRDFDVILGRPTDKSITVGVMAQKPMEIELRFGQEGDPKLRETQRKSIQPDEPAEWVLDGLESDQQYRYELLAKTSDSAEFEMRSIQTFRTARKPGSSFSFAIQADSHLDQATRSEVYEKTLEKIVSEKPDFFVDLGDTFMTDKYPKHSDAKPQYLAQRYFLGLVARSSPLFLVLGNHDGERGDRFDGTAESMPGWSNMLRKKLYPNPEPDGFYSGNEAETPPLGRLQNYYSWTWGDARMIVLDPFWPTRERARGAANAPADANWSRTLGDEQYRWLKQTLETSKSQYKFVFIHHLVGGLDRSARGGAEAAKLYEWGGRSATGENEFARRRPGWAMPIHDLFVKHGVSAVFHGHDHFYARQELDGVAYVLVPQPGHSGGGNASRSAKQYGYETGIMKSSPGHVLVTISHAAAVVEFVRTAVTRIGDRQNVPDDSGDRFLIVPR